MLINEGSTLASKVTLSSEAATEESCPLQSRAASLHLCDGSLWGCSQFPDGKVSLHFQSPFSHLLSGFSFFATFLYFFFFIHLIPYYLGPRGHQWFLHLPGVT